MGQGGEDEEVRGEGMPFFKGSQPSSPPPAAGKHLGDRARLGPGPGWGLGQVPGSLSGPGRAVSSGCPQVGTKASFPWTPYLFMARERACACPCL